MLLENEKIRHMKHIGLDKTITFKLKISNQVISAWKFP